MATIRTATGSRGEHPRAWPTPVLVHIGGQWLPATAHTRRIGRRGGQVLISRSGRMFWISALRVTPAPAAPPNQPTSGGA